MCGVAGEIFNSETRLSWVLAGLAGVLGAIAYMHSAGYFVTFMTGNAQRVVLGYFRHDVVLAVSAGVLLLCFVAGVVVASMCRRRFWTGHPHGPTVLTTFSLLAATAVDFIDEGWEEAQLDFAPIMLVVFGVGALNTSFVKDGEVSIPLSYVTARWSRWARAWNGASPVGNPRTGLATFCCSPASSWVARWVAASAWWPMARGCW
jgi:uncharacterized membrane protein YoaK (UPF0700 family)